ncbi:MAG TPA: hypothetical protein VER03_15445 [Bryobacteraceae bacterium]|nr:hypothetical protein [Bryobacteraceae bacterium]
MSDPRQQGRVRLTAAEPGAAERPVQKPVAAKMFVRPAAGLRPQLATESFLDFTPNLALEGLEAVLNTTGFEDVEDAPVRPLINAAAPVEVVPPVTFAAPPVAKPAIELKPPSTPIAVYEPIEFLDYEDDEEADVAEAYSEPELEPEPEPEPPALSEPFAIAWPNAVAPGVAKMQQGYASIALADTPIELPDLALKTVRPRILRGTNPFAPKPAPAPASAPVPETPVIQARPTPPPAPAKATPTVTAKPAQPAVRPAAAVPPAPVPPAVVHRPAAAAAAVSPALAKTEPAKTSAPPERDRRPAAAAKAPAAPAPQQAPTPNRPPLRDRGNAVPVEEVLEQPTPAPKPKMVPIRKPEPVAAAASAPERADNLPMLGMPEEQKSPITKIGMVAVVVAVLAGGAYVTFSGGKSSARASGPEETISDNTNPGMVIGGGGWTTTWGADSPVNKGKQISIYRPSMTMPDYRLEFRGQIEKKALGWIFRAQDPKNYYVMKLQTLKPGASPVVALVKYAVIDGKETTHTQTMLPFPVSLDTVYQVRVDVKGDKFTTYVQGKLLDYWTDDRIKLGGAGFYTETGERSQIKSSQVSYLK